jgi:hypothetical protein
MDKKKILKFYHKIFIIWLCLVTLISPILLLWNVEISMEFKPDIILTNGFYDTQPIKVYHFLIYLTLLSIFCLVLFILFNLEKLL